MKQKSFAVLGLGKFGLGVSEELMNRGAQVLVADHKADLIDQVAANYTQAVAAELTDVKAIRSLGLGTMDAVIVAMAKDLEASIMCVMIAKESGVHKVIAKAETKRKGDILKRIGADEIIYPERDSGVRTAFRLMSQDVFQFFDLSSDLFLIEMRPRPEWIGKSLSDLQIRSNNGINVIAFRRGDSVRTVKSSSTVIEKDVPMLIVMSREDLDRFLP